MIFGEFVFEFLKAEGCYRRRQRQFWQVSASPSLLPTFSLLSLILSFDQLSLPNQHLLPSVPALYPTSGLNLDSVSRTFSDAQKADIYVKEIAETYLVEDRASNLMSSSYPPSFLSQV